ncbi:capsule assembly Wzi family protein [Algoriphagus sp. PAP.12]|uniref:capsule assembly Wzi family protein n=1 Tax=Algoriphagus sp. PAP.12 TaxID=2996678 RepID=UPI00227B55CC|nr:capsule assembly Wzi family protein [Algoriphagus sp. PAP.12]
MKRYPLILFVFFSFDLLGQSIPAGFPIFEEIQRRNQLRVVDTIGDSFLIRPVHAMDTLYRFNKILDFAYSKKKLEFGVSPFINTTRILSNRPYNMGDYGMIPNPGYQTYLSGGINVKWKFINLDFRPELVIAQNKGYQTSLDQFTDSELRSKFFYWNRGDFPERFGKGWLISPWWGQSKLSFQFSGFEIGAATENVWWGPGQWNALTFSNSAQGFPHLTLNTTKPAKTFFGYFETQLVIGKLDNSGYDPSQFPELNDQYFKPFSEDWRYLNALMVSYNPKWIPRLFLGFTRTFQQYRGALGNGFLDYFPVFNGLTKDQYGYDRDADGQDQQITIFGRYVIPKSKSEFYFEYGRRDHSKNWREFILNPEHARAYILGFIQLFDLPSISKLIQVRGEVTQAQESVNRYIRYGGFSGGLGGGYTWHTHSKARGFVQNGQPLGVVIAPGANVQTLEFSMVEGIDKMGILLERLVNNQDFYYKAQLQATQRKPWVDFSLGILYDKKIKNLLLSSKLQVIHARNYQWQLDPASTPDFPKGKNLTSMMAQVSLIYFWNKNLDK